MSFRVSAYVTVDTDANAAMIRFAQESVFRPVVLPVENGADLLATAEFSAEGRLVGIELLDARKQLPFDLPKPRPVALEKER
ncbi:MAG: DUF2283 domain-containing protein [Propionibacteriaceae bacterium]|nr:DUF2283 domain-containing protein [Propionibacteriaceae bacterium]